MASPNLLSIPTRRPEPELQVKTLVSPFFRRRRLVASVVFVAWLIGLGAVLLPARRYQATVLLAAVPNTKTASLSGGLAALIGSAQLGGIQATPYFIAKLLLLRNVIMSVALSPMDSGRKELVIERVTEHPLAEVRPERIESKMRNILDADVDKQTGLITFSVVHRDSALVRTISNRIITAASKTFVDVIRAQASSQRAAEEVRVDSAQHRLRRAEQELLDFVSSNRSLATYASATLARQRLDRELSNAQGVYTQAVTDQEAAIARELEETPAVVVVDSIPSKLFPMPRMGLLKMMLATVLGLIAAACVMWMQGEFDPTKLESA